jgi:hypothetical protein
MSRAGRQAKRALPDIRILVVGMLALSALVRDGHAGDFDKYCAPAAANVVLYLDVTTPYDAIDRASLVDGVEKIFAALGDGDRLSIRTIEDSFPNSHRLIDACMPFCKSEGFLNDLFSDCTEGVVIEDKRRLQTDIVAEITKVASNSVELKTSEIIRTLALSSAEEYRKGQENAFFIFSDMIENSTYLPSGDFLRERNSQIISNLAKDRLVPNLRGAVVTVFGVGRKGDPQARDALEQKKIDKITDFWEAFFSLAGATMTWQPNLGPVKQIGQ